MDTPDRRLTSARERIEDVDRELIRLLKQRMEAVELVAEHKRDTPEVRLHDPEREAKLAEVWEAEARGLGLSAYHARRILKEVLTLSRRSQEATLGPQHPSRTCRVGYQGVSACYSEIAARKLFAHRGKTALDLVGSQGFTEVIDSLEEGRLEFALLPVENTIIGSISEVNGLLATRNVSVVDEEILEVEHCLVGLPGAAIDELRTIRSHPAALQQCQRLLGSLPDAAAEHHFDTAGAAQSVRDAKDPSIGCIASAEAAERFGLEVLRARVADQPGNWTRFLLLAREPASTSRQLPTKTTVRFAVNHRAGALADSLTAFARHGVNLVRLESRPQPQAPWEYLFLADLDGHRDDANVEAALEELRSHTNHLKVLGSYPSRAVEQADPGANASAPAPPAVPVERCSVPAQPAAAPRPTSSPGDDAKFDVAGIPVGGREFTLILGPCAVEDAAQIHDAAAMVKAHGAQLMRGGAFKPRSSPHSFQGLGFEGLDLLADAGRAVGLPVVTEVLQPEDVDAIAEKADVLQIGARNMQNFALLKKVGRTHRPVLLKRGMSATVKELLQAAEYIRDGGNQRVILCERGIRTFETATRNTLDVSSVPVLKTMTDLPVIVDPSHAAGVRHLVVPLALASAAAGADGLIIECHPRPEEALCDKDQALTEKELAQLLAGLPPILESQGRSLRS